MSKIVEGGEQNRRLITVGVGVGLLIFGADPATKALGVSLILAGLAPLLEEPEKLDNPMRGRSLTTLDAIAPWQVIYGETVTGGNIVFATVSGPKREFLDLIVVLAAHEVEEITAVFLNNELVELSPGEGDKNNGILEYGVGKWADHVTVDRTRLGTDGQDASEFLRDATRPIKTTKVGTRFDGFGNYAATEAQSQHNPPFMTLVVNIQPARAKIQETIIAHGDNWRLTKEDTGAIRFTDASGNFVETAQDIVDGDEVPAVLPGEEAFIVVLARPDTFTPGSMIIGIFKRHSFIPKGGTRITPRPTVFYYTLENSRRSSIPYDNGAGSEVTYVGSLDGESEFFQGRIGYVNIWDELWPNSVINGEPYSSLTNIHNSSPGTRQAYYKLLEGDGPDEGIDPDKGESTLNDLTLVPTWTLDYRLRGRAYLHIRLKWDADLFPQGIPNITCKVKGKKVYDPRTTLTVYSNNAALCLADYLMDGNFGLGVPLADIDETLLGTAADDCEDAIAILPSGTQERYTTNGAFTVDRTPQSIIEALLTSFAGIVVYVGGKWTIYAGVWRIPTETLTDDDFRGPLHIETLISRQDNFNAVRGTHLSEDANFLPTNYPVVTNALYETEDGEINWGDIPFEFTPNSTRVQRLAKIALERIRQSITITVPCTLAAFRIQPPCVVLITHATMGWTNKPFEVVGGVLTADADGGIGYDLTLRETDESVYDWAAGEATTADPAPNTQFPNPFENTGMGGITLESGEDQLHLNSDGTVVSRIKVSWIKSDYPFLTNGGFLEIQYRQTVGEIALEVAGAPWEIAFLDSTLANLRSYRSDLTDWIIANNALDISDLNDIAITALTSTLIVVATTDGLGDGTLTAYQRNSVSNPPEWTQLGTSLTIEGMGTPAIASLSASNIVLVDDGNQELRVYRYNSSFRARQTGTEWIQIGSGFALEGSVDTPSITALSSTDIAVYDGGRNILVRYHWDGANFTQVGNALPIGGATAAAIVALSDTRVALLLNGLNVLRTYDHDGTDWSQTGNSLTILGLGTPSMAHLNPLSVVIIDSSVEEMQIHVFDETDWAPSGNPLTISGIGIPGVATLSGIDISSANPTIFIEHSELETTAEDERRIFFRSRADPIELPTPLHEGTIYYVRGLDDVHGNTFELSTAPLDPTGEEDDPGNIEFLDVGAETHVLILSNQDQWSESIQVDGDANFAFISDVQDALEYDVRVRTINNIGVRSAWIQSLAHEVIGKIAPPDNVTGFKASRNGLSATFVWDQVGNVDLGGYEIRYGVEGILWDDALTLTETQRGTRVTDAAVPPSPSITETGIRAPWDFLIKALDTSGNYSPDATRTSLVINTRFDAIFNFKSGPVWPGIKTNLHRNPLKGHLNPTSQRADSLFFHFGPNLEGIQAMQYADGVWTQVGNAFPETTINTLTSLGGGNIAVGRSGTSIVWMYHWNDTKWVRVGIGNIAAAGCIDITGMTKHGAVIAESGVGNNDLVWLHWNGMNWDELARISFTENDGAKTDRMTDTDFAYANSFLGELRRYTFDGFTISIVGIGVSIPVMGEPWIAVMNENDVVFIDDNNRELSYYRWTGSTFVQLGNTLSFPLAHIYTLVKVNDTDVAINDGDAGTMQVFHWDGSDFIAVDSPSSITGPSPSSGFSQLGDIHNFGISTPGNNQDVFDNFVVNPHPESSYEAAEVDAVAGVSSGE